MILKNGRNTINSALIGIGPAVFSRRRSGKASNPAADFINGAATAAAELSSSLAELGSAISSKHFLAADAVAPRSADLADALRQPNAVPTWKQISWAATTVVARDFLITGLRLMASAEGRILPAETLGKQKTSWQIVTIIFFLALLSIAELHDANEMPTWWLRAWGQGGPVLVWITVALTLYSGLGYAWRNRELLTPDQ